MKVRSILLKALCAMAFAASLGAHADEYGCTVLMCLSNPKGPTQANGCQPPIQKFIDSQAKQPADPFPQCPESKGELQGKMGMNPYDACPVGTTALAAGTEIIQGIPVPQSGAQGGIYRPSTPSKSVWISSPSVLTYYTGIGDGEKMRAANGQKICVGKSLGPVTLLWIEPTNNETQSKTVEAFDRVVTMDAAAGSPRYIDITISGKEYRRVRL